MPGGELLRRTATSLILAAVIAPVALAEVSSELGQVNSILDRLEKRLQRREAQGLTFDNDESPRKDKPAKTFNLDPAKIEGTTPSREDIAEVEALVDRLEREIEDLSSDVRREKQTILEDARADNFVSLAAVLQEKEKTALTSLRIRLDGYDIYAVDESSGLWMPSSKIPLYAGPLEPGTHTLDLKARLVMRHEGKPVPFKNQVARFINKRFKFSVPSGSSRAGWTVALAPPTSANASAGAELKKTSTREGAQDSAD